MDLHFNAVNFALPTPSDSRATDRPNVQIPLAGPTRLFVAGRIWSCRF